MKKDMSNDSSDKGRSLLIKRLVKPYQVPPRKFHEATIPGQLRSFSRLHIVPSFSISANCVVRVVWSQSCVPRGVFYNFVILGWRRRTELVV